MKSFKNMLVMVAVFAIGSMNAKQMVRQPGYTGGITTPTIPTLIEPSATEIEKQLAAQIDQMTSIVETNNNATQQFINLMQQSNLPSNVKQDYLQAATQSQNMIAQSGKTNKNKILQAKGFGLISTVRPQGPNKR